MTRSTGLLAFYSVSLLLVFHSFLVAYSNSSYLEQFIGSEHVGGAYLGASALTVFIFLFISYILRSVGNYRITMILLALDGLAVTGLAFATTASVVVPLLLVHITVIPLIFFNLDVFLEGMIGNQEHTTGSKRGLLLAISSFIGAISPLLSGFLIEAHGFAFSYLVAAIALVPVTMILIFYFRTFCDPEYHEIRVLEAIRSFWVRHNIRMVFLAHLLLQIFFCFMVVYAPLYLATVIGLSWSEIGIVLFAAQLAYVFLEYPIGYVADRLLGEQEMMATGFVVLAVSTAFLAAIDTPSVFPWILAMFMTRVGAALVEVTTESYFFKHMQSSDAQIISFFRLTRPLSYVIGACIGTITLVYLPFGFVFIVVGFLMTTGIIFALELEDTK
jgi:MFS family permease